ncbi:flavin monoamine oxidase family protein [Streptomyces sp. DT171]|uniref:flavin monoamine oxidase family protein n=1 Tax=Streptomyces sp. DT171 TaxID=3416524 RepID=UPI003CF474CF
MDLSALGFHCRNRSGGLSGLWEIFGQPEEGEPRMNSEYETIVVGAGAAGLAAAEWLRKNDANHKVLVLEAAKRVGGRLFTSTEWGGDYPLDIGASWIHGNRGNPVAALRDEYDIRTVVTDLDSLVLYDSSGNPVPEADQEAMRADAEEMIAEFDRTGKLPKGGTGTSKHADHDRGVSYFLWQHFQNEFGAAPDEVAHLWYSDAVFLGAQEVMPGGYGQFVQKLSQGVKCRSGSRVRAISWNDGGARVTVADEEYDCKQVIVTVPLGVLKGAGIAFTPELPAEKTAAIEKLRMGTLSKTWLLFPKVFWDRNTLTHAYLGTKDNIWSEWYSFADVYDGRAVLLCLNGGEGGTRVEKLEDAEIVEEAMTVLKKIFPDAERPVKIAQSRWTQDADFRGSYSYTPRGATPDDRDALAAPVSNRLFFAGEATHSTCHQTVHGALLSGRRAAKEVIAVRR